MKSPYISLIVAASENGVIGNNGKLPWRIPEDMTHFVARTWGKACIMGRKTYESIRKPLQGRENIVITRDPTWKAPGVYVVQSLEEAIDLAKALKPEADEIMIIGGAEIYALALPIADRVYLTKINKSIEGDTHFELDDNQWRLYLRVPPSISSVEGNWEFEFLTFVRREKNKRRN